MVTCYSGSETSTEGSSSRYSNNVTGAEIGGSEAKGRVWKLVDCVCAVCVVSDVSGI